MEAQRLDLIYLIQSIPTFGIGICSYILLSLVQPEDSERILEYNPELFCALASFRAASSIILGTVESFLRIEEGATFRVLAEMYAERTNQLRFGIEDVLSHYNQTLYVPASIFPHLYELRTQFRLAMPEVARRYFRWFNAVPTCIIPLWAFFALEDELFNPCGHINMRCPIYATYMWPSSALYFGRAAIWPPQPLRGVAWGTIGRVTIIGHFTTPGARDRLVIPVWPSAEARTDFCSFRYGLLDGTILE